jgi:hypothetical protein
MANECVNIARQSQTERQGGASHERTADPVHIFGVLAGIDDPVIGGRSHQHHDGERDQQKAGRMHDNRGFR